MKMRFAERQIQTSFTARSPLFANDSESAMPEEQAHHETASDTEHIEPTPGPWTNKYAGNPDSDKETMGVKTAGEHHVYIAKTNMARPEAENLANARLIAAAGTAASELPKEYDPVKAVEALPLLIDALQSMAAEEEEISMAQGHAKVVLDILRKEALA